MSMELLLSDPSGKKLFLPVVEEGIEWSTERTSTPGKLTFKVVKDDIIDFQEGAAVRFKFNDKGIFFGFVLPKSEIKIKLLRLLRMINCGI